MNLENGEKNLRRGLAGISFIPFVLGFSLIAIKFSGFIFLSVIRSAGFEFSLRAALLAAATTFLSTVFVFFDIFFGNGVSSSNPES